MGILRLLAKLVLFWLIFFTVQQLAFIAVNFSAYNGTFWEVLAGLWKAFAMNLSATAYVLLPAMLIIIAGLFGLWPKVVNGFIRWETFVLLVVCSFIRSGDMGLFKVWGTIINVKALLYLQYPEEVMPTVFAVQNLALILIVVAQVVFGIWLYKRMQINFEKPDWQWWLKPIFGIVVIGLSVLAGRGGFQKVPVNRNWVFQSKHSVINYSAVNGFWNVLDLVFHPLDKQDNPYVFYDIETAEHYIDDLYKPIEGQPDSTTYFLTTDKPNIVFVFLESWAGDVIEGLGGEKGVAPKFEELTKEGIFFKQFYATGYRTEQGYLATFSATPALPVGSVMQLFGKFDKLPNMYALFNQMGYHTSFYSGGRLSFDNVEAYLGAAGVNVMKGRDDWTIRRQTLWGAYDEETFAMHAAELNTLPQPFFSSVSTMTTHEWFDADVPQLFNGDADVVNDHYRNTVHYADSCLYAYLQDVKKEPWYANTIFIVMADHSCSFPKGRNNYETERHHIPMLITGGAIKEEWRGKSIQRVGSQLDIAATLLNQMKQPATDFAYSKNLFNASSPAFAYYAFDNGFGIVSDSTWVIYDHNRNGMLNDTTPQNRRWERGGKASLELQVQENIDFSKEAKAK
jgi:phosphoglycerol transferase MdoB-like AlkP superfamily enzyme